MKRPSSTLCLSTYNWPAALKLCLASVLRQHVMPDEIIIADDGSAEETEKVVSAFAKQCPIPVKHIWQPDEGFQLAKIRNKAFAAASGDYIIQADSDLLLHPYFVSDHLRYARRDCFISGARAMLNSGASEALLSGEAWSYPEYNSPDLGKKYNALRNPVLAAANYYLQRGTKSYKYVLGCNMSFWKKDLIRVNGYNEAFKGWGKEDNDIAIRLINSGVHLRFLKFGGVVYHLHHKTSDQQGLKENEALFEMSITNKVTSIEDGMSRYCEAQG